MKLFKVVLIFIILFSFINSTCISGWNLPDDASNEEYENFFDLFDDEQFDKSASSSECTKRALHSVERSIYKGYKCCFLKKTCKEDGETDTVQYCYPLTQTEYNK